MFKYYTYKGLCLFNPEIINSNSLSNINKLKNKRKISFPFNIDFKLNYFKEKTHFFGSGIYVIEYDNNRRKGRTWHVPIKNNHFYLFPSTQKYFFTANKSKQLNTILTITYEYI